jgi:hypothetical protein
MRAVIIRPMFASCNTSHMACTLAGPGSNYPVAQSFLVALEVARFLRRGQNLKWPRHFPGDSEFLSLPSRVTDAKLAFLRPLVPGGRGASGSALYRV